MRIKSSKRGRKALKVAAIGVGEASGGTHTAAIVRAVLFLDPLSVLARNPAGQIRVELDNGRASGSPVEPPYRRPADRQVIEIYVASQGWRLP